MPDKPDTAKDSRLRDGFRRAFPPRAWALVAAVAYWAALFVATHLPGDDRVDPQRVIPHLDKAIHAAAFAGLGFLLAFGVSGWWKPGPWLYLSVIALLGLYATVDELSQGLVSRRYSDLRDWVADILGAIAGVAVFGLLERWWSGRRIPSGRGASAP